MFKIESILKTEKNKYVKQRRGETHIGQNVKCCGKRDTPEVYLDDDEVRFVLLCLPEDFGVRANYGIGGAKSAWQPFLNAFFNTQATETFSGESLFLYGRLKHFVESGEIRSLSVNDLRKRVEEIDEVVAPVIRDIVSANKIPIVIGGGHNNAYPMLKGASLAFKKSVNALNIDAHADFRALEGRHSGNGFSYAHKDKFLKNYFVLGLHEGYNSQDMLERMKQAKTVQYRSWEDIFLRETVSWQEAIDEGLAAMGKANFGVEMDLDAIQNVLSSAQTPVGLEPREALQALYQAGRNPNSIYLHLPEGVVDRSDGLKNPFTGKLLSYLVHAFIKGVLDRGK